MITSKNKLKYVSYISNGRICSMQLLTILFIVLVICIIWKICNDITYYKIKNKESAKRYANLIEYKPLKKSLDYYRLGEIYDHVLHDEKKAMENYHHAIMMAWHDADNEAAFVRDRIRDRIFEVPENDDVKVDMQELYDAFAIFEHALADVLLERKGPIENRINWLHDNQNVHDSSITNELATNFRKLKHTNITIDDIESYLRNEFVPAIHEEHYVGNAIEMLNYIKSHDGLVLKIGANESTLITRVFAAIRENQTSGKAQMENLVMNLSESYNDGTPVCIIGRVTRIMSSLAGADPKNPEIGIFKSRQIIKNEIFAKAASIRNKILDSTDKNLVDKYNNDDDSEEVKKLINDIKIHISNVIEKEYDKDIAKEALSEIENAQ